MKTNLNINHRLLMGLLVLGSVFSMIVSSAFTTTSAWAAALAPGGTGAATLSSINSPSLHTEDAVTLTVGSISSRDKDDQRPPKKHESSEDSNTAVPVTELSGTVSGLVMGPTLTSFSVAGVGLRMDTSLIQEWTIANGDSVTVEGYYLGPNNTGTFLVTEMDKAQ
jgi:hypothetical protein